MKKICVITLGCPKNLVDSERIVGVAGSSGCAITTDIKEADYVILNTCSFIRPALLEARRTISRLKKLKEKFFFKLIIAGCLPARSPEFLLMDNGIDGVIGPYNISRIPELLRDIDSGRKADIIEYERIRHFCHLPRAVSTWPYAYLKITEGCSNMCSYCTIPLIRGRLVSFPEREILKEAEFLFQIGIKELIVIGHDITSYGKDTKRDSVVNLLRRIADIGFRWIRLMYLHPAGITDELLELVNDNPCFCRYLDIPIQHINPVILRKMNRPAINYKRFFEYIRNSVPGVCLRTTLMVGFPGETDRIFDELVEFVEETRFQRLGAFVFSPEKGTKAFLMSGQVSPEKKQARLKILMSVQGKINRQISSSFVGSTVEVLVEKKMDDHFEGRTRMDAPDIDCKVRFKGRANPGDIVRVKIHRSSTYVLHGRVVS